MTQPVTVHDDLGLAVGSHIVVRLEADEALDLAAELARRAFRRIAHEERADFVFDDEGAAGHG